MFLSVVCSVALFSSLSLGAPTKPHTNFEYVELHPSQLNFNGKIESQLKHVNKRSLGGYGGFGYGQPSKFKFTYIL